MTFGWKMFWLVVDGDGTVSLRCNANGRYVRVRSDGVLIADREAAGPAESFDAEL